MKKVLYLLIASGLLIFSQHTSAQTVSKSKLIGSWAGKINAAGVELRVIFNLSIAGKDSLVATLDSPDQGAKGIGLGLVTLTGKTLKIAAPALMAEYNGTVMSDVLIKGTWTQGGSTFNLDLTKSKTTSSLNFIQHTIPANPFTDDRFVITADVALNSKTGDLIY